MSQTSIKTETTTKNNPLQSMAIDAIDASIKAAIIAEFKAAEAAAAEAEAAAQKAAAEAAAAEAAAAKKAEQKAILQGKKAIDNTVLAELLPFDIAFKYAIADINANGIQKHLKQVQKAEFKESHFEQLTKSINLCLKQFSNADLETYVTDKRCTLPSKFITAIVNGSCKSTKSFENSKTKVLPKNDKLS